MRPSRRPKPSAPTSTPNGMRALICESVTCCDRFATLLSKIHCDVMIKVNVRSAAVYIATSLNADTRYTKDYNMSAATDMGSAAVTTLHTQCVIPV